MNSTEQQHKIILQEAKAYCEKMLEAITLSDQEAFATESNKLAQLLNKGHAQARSIKDNRYKHDILDFIFHCDMYEDMDFTDQGMQQTWIDKIFTKLENLS